MNNKGRSGRLSVRTVLLMLAVMSVILALFVGLPSNLVLKYAIKGDTVIGSGIFWSCSQNREPERYDRWTWDTEYKPEIIDWIDVMLERIYYVRIKCHEMQQPEYAGEPDRGILQNLHSKTSESGKLHFELNPENENQIIVSGYLQYGELGEIDDETYEYLWDHYSAKYSPLIPEVIDPEVLAELLSIASRPIKRGIERNEDLKITVTNWYTENISANQVKTTTDRNGYFSRIIEPDPEAEYYEIEVQCSRKVLNSGGQGSLPVIYWENFTVYTSYFDCDGKRSESETERTYREWIFFGIVLAGTVFLVAWYLWHRKRLTFAGDEEETGEKVPQTNIPDEFVTSKSGDTVRLEIRFPQIEADLADVWSTDSPLEVRFRLKDAGGTIIPDTECRIDWGDGLEETAVSDVNGEITVSHRFTEKADYAIIGSYTDIGTNEEVSGTRSVRIVDYREETVYVFNRMLNRLDIGIVGIDRRLTAREIRGVLINEIRDVPGIVIDVIIDIFEEADYSTHEIDRNRYVRMYRAVKEVIEIGERNRDQGPAE